MSEIKAVLLIPEEGDPHKLLKKGPYGARPPWAARCATCQRWVGGDGEGLTCHCFRGPAIPSALVLAWNGESVAEGGPWLSSKQRWGWLGTVIELLAGESPDKYMLMTLAGGGTLVLLDAEGQGVGDE